MNLMSKPPLGQKPPPSGKDAAYLAKVRQLPCAICFHHGMYQHSPTEAHHVKSGRYGRLKTPDRMAIPLCHSHHNKLRRYPGDDEKIGFHNRQRTWEGRYGADTIYIPWTQDMVEALR